MIDRSKNYRSLHAYTGTGSDIKWCGRWSGGKRCLYCRHHAEFEEWSSKWHWHYLISWRDQDWWWSREFAHFKYGGGYWSRFVKHTRTYKNESPRRYFTVGLKENDLKSLLKKGCKKKRKCKCVNLAQRGTWCCPECYHLLTRLAKHHGVDVHDIMISDRDDLKQDILILLLSGTL